MATVRLSRGAENDVAKADGASRLAIAKGLAKLTTSPHLRGEALRDELQGLRKLVVGARNIRIVYLFDVAKDIVTVIAIEKRRDEKVYKLAIARLGELDEGQ